MIKGSGTSSSLLWEVQRILIELGELPQYLLMENVPQVISKQNMPFFKEWILFLNKLGYSNNYELLNAKDYGIPQNRNRCFMISKLNDNTPFIFPEKVKLNLKIKNILDKYISNNKYYLPEKYLKSIEFTNKNVIADLHYTTYESSNKIYNSNGICPTLRASEREFDYLKSTKIGYFENNNFICRLLTPKEHLRLMGLKDKEIDKFTVNGNQQCKQAGNSIVVNVLIAIFKNLLVEKSKEANYLF